jgi:hypothetical protein
MPKYLTSYEDLLKIHGDKESISYQELLSTQEWKLKKNEIQKRDSYVCQNCKKRKTERFEIESLLSILKTNNLEQTWKIVGKFRTKTERIEPGNYWHLSESSFKKFNAYTGEKYIKTPDGWILIQSKKEYKLNVHHKIYILNILPWENLNKDFETYCNWCHLEIHLADEIECYRIINKKLIPAKMTPCLRCHGKGKLTEYEHIENGICFRCFGKRFEELIED